MDESGHVVRELATDPSEAATFSNLDPTTSDAQAMGGSSSIKIWGTNVSIPDTMAVFKDFLKNYKKKYRMWAEGVSSEETANEPDGETSKYLEMMQNMLALGIANLNLDLRDIKAYPPTNQLWQQIQSYPQDLVVIMDQAIKDTMFELAEEEVRRRKASQSSQGTAARSRSRIMSSEPPTPSSDRIEPEVATPRSVQEADEDDLTQEVLKTSYKVRPFGLDATVNMRDLNPSGMLNPSQAFAIPDLYRR